MTSLGFIVLRHVNDTLTNKYWIRCVNCIRQHYPENHILIIDDNSNYTFISDEKFYKTTIIKSEFPKRGEVLPYYYYLHNKLFDVAVIIHDSVFINKFVDMTVDKYKLIWEFEHGDSDQTEDEIRILNVFNDLELNEFYKNRHLWKGCYGGMSVITHDYLTFINNKYDISKLLNCIQNRHNRMSFERVIGCLLQKNGEKQTLLGNIHYYCPWGIRYNKVDEYNHLPFTKIWSGR
jgi:hypothetical protein